MGLTKHEIYTSKQIELAKVANALSHPARIAIIEELMNKNTCICGELVTEIGLSQSTISQHLKELKDVGLIKGTIDGTKNCYCIDYDNLNKNRELIDNFLTTAIKLQIICC